MAQTESDALATLGGLFRAEASELRQASESLAERLAQLSRDADGAALKLGREGWRRAALGWQSFSCLPSVLDRQSDRVAAGCYFPVRPSAMATLLDADVQPVAKLGVDRKGIYGLELLLFDAPDAPAACRVDGPRGQRARRLGLDASRELGQLAADFERELAGRDFPSLGHAGLGLVLNRLVEDLESLVENRLGIVLAMQAVGRLQPGDVQGFASHSSHELLGAAFGLLEKLYPAALVRARSAEVAGHSDAQLATARAAVAALDRPLPELVATDRASLEHAVAALKALERGLKTEVAQALGVTLTIHSFDGD